VILKTFEAVPRRQTPLTVASGEHGFPAEHLCQHTADAPHVDRARVLFKRQHDLGGAIPPEDASDAGLGGSGATHRVATYSVMNVLLSLATFGGGRADRARPKSQSWRG
jgi:hypothetical protein